MARFAFVWELGGAYGHLGRMIPVARELQRRGHEAVFVIRELVEAERLLGPHGFAWYQAPLWTGRVLNLPEAINHAEVLMRFGFLNPQALLGMCRAWRNQWQLLQPDALVLDYAPTAVLASRGQGLPVLNLTNGFQTPPAAQPLPPLCWWQPAPAARLLDSERQVMAVANQVLCELGAPPVGGLLDLLSGGPSVFAILRELDHFKGRTEGDFVGPIFSLGRGEPVVWPGSRPRRVFAYLKADYAALEPLLTALSHLDASVLVHIPGVPQRTLTRFASEHFSITRQPLDIDQVRQSCDLAVLHGGMNTTAALLLAGKPVLLFPQQMEQAMFARSAQALGAAAVFMEGSAGQFPRLIARALAEPSLAQAAQAFAQRYRDFEPAQAIQAVADRCEALLAKP